MNEHIRFTGPADILAYVPHSLGHHPSESFVLLTMNGKRLGATLRIDAPAEAVPLDYAQTLTTHLAADENATATLLVIYSNETAPGGGAPYRDHVDALSNELTLADMPLKDAWIVTGTHWRNYLCTDPTCCPAQPLDSITDSNGNAAMIYTGSTITGIPEPAPFTGDPDVAEAIAAAIPQGWPEDLDGARALWNRALTDPAALTGQAARELAGAFQHPTTRDYLYADTITTAPEQFTAVILGVVTARPDWARVDRAQELAFELMKTTPEAQRAPLLCLIGWLDWLKGKASFAARYFKLAQDDVTGFRLAVLLAELVNRGLIADVARNKATAYTPPARA
jgi:hypothetical protein